MKFGINTTSVVLKMGKAKLSEMSISMQREWYSSQISLLFSCMLFPVIPLYSMTTLPNISVALIGKTFDRLTIGTMYY